MRQIAFNVHTINEHPDPEKCFDWIRENWHDLGDYVLEEMIDSLKAAASYFGATVDWSISIFPDRGEYITFDIGEDSAEKPARDFVNPGLLSGDCPFTGVCYDEVILDAFRKAERTETLREVLHDVEYRVLKALHAEGEYLYSDDGLREMCEANEYEFYEDGSIA